MSHPQDLIEAIRAQVQRDYPPALFRFETEKALPKTRYFPDIAVFDSRNKVACVVEIGYTRPEKLSFYRKNGIPDVRWYDKAGHLHADVQKRVLVAEVKFKPAPTSVFGVIHDCFACPSLECQQELEALAAIWKRYDRRFVEDKPAGRKRYRSGTDRLCARFEKAGEDAAAYVETICVTDGVKLFLPSFCDKCGEMFDAASSDGLMLGIFKNEIEAGTMARDHTRLLRDVSWDEARAFIEAHAGFRLDYEASGTFVREDIERSVQQQVSVTMRHEREGEVEL